MFFDALNFSLLLSGDEEIEALRCLSSSTDINTVQELWRQSGHWAKDCWKPGGGAYDNSTYRNTGKGKSIQKRQRPTKMDDAELLKYLRGLGKLRLFDGNDIDVSFSSMCLKTIRSFCVA